MDDTDFRSPSTAEFEMLCPVGTKQKEGKLIAIYLLANNLGTSILRSSSKNNFHSHDTKLQIEFLTKTLAKIGPVN